jgi:hypothetical protein
MRLEEKITRYRSAWAELKTVHGQVADAPLVQSLPTLKAVEEIVDTAFQAILDHQASTTTELLLKVQVLFDELSQTVDDETLLISFQANMERDIRGLEGLSR